MKWCFLVNPAPLIVEFFAKFARQVVKEGDEYIIVVNNKITEYDKNRYFPKNARIFSEVDWCIENYKENQKRFQGLSWKGLFSEFDRFNRFNPGNFNYHNSVEIIAQSYQFIDFIFQKEKPDVVVGEIVTGIFGELFYFLSEKNNANYLGLLGSRIKDRFDVYDLKHTCSKYEKTFREINSDNISETEKNLAKDFIEKFISHKQLPPYMDYQNQRIQLGEISRIKSYIKREKEMLRYYLRYFLKRKHYKPFDYNSEFLIHYNFHYPWEALKRRIRTLFQKNIFDSPNNKDKFFLYPLHLQPEASTSVLATYYCDQINTIKNIAFSLPFPYKLYVKEHPSAVGTNSGYFYRKIKEIPNTVLIPHYENVEELIRKSQGLVVLTSTVGMEAVLAGKPVYALGEVFYDYHPLCRKINNFEELRQRIQKDLIENSVIDDLENINVRFIVSYLRNIIVGDIAAASSKNDINDYKAIYEDIVKIFFKDKD